MQDVQTWVSFLFQLYCTQYSTCIVRFFENCSCISACCLVKEEEEGRLLATIRSAYSYTWILIYFTFISLYLFSCPTHIYFFNLICCTLLLADTCSGQICTYIHTSIHTHTYKPRTKKLRTKKEQKGGVGKEKGNKQKKEVEKEDNTRKGGRRGQRKRTGGWVRGVEERGYLEG